jgi:hypothetical protein
MKPALEQHAALMRQRVQTAPDRPAPGPRRRYALGRLMHRRRLWRERERKIRLRRKCREHPIAVSEGIFHVGSSWPDLEAYLWRTLGPPAVRYRTYQ